MEMIFNLDDIFQEILFKGEYAYECIFLISVSLFFTILFLQSGIDKIVSFAGNLTYFQNHFKNTFLKNQVKFLLISITLLECLTGFLFSLALIYLIIAGGDNGFGILTALKVFYFPALVFAFITLCSLFFGQRVAQDYVGAVNLGIYFLIALIAFSLPVLFLELP